MHNLDVLRQLLSNQFEAALCTLHHCLQACPDNAWEQPVVSLSFSQVGFHTLFYADYYLGAESDPLHEQPFHQKNQQHFRDYEELQDRKQSLNYDRAFLLDYASHCRRKAIEVCRQENDDVLNGPSGFARRSFSRAELHLYNIRHIQHHAANLGLHLRIHHAVPTPWIGSGWRDGPG